MSLSRKNVLSLAVLLGAVTTFMVYLVLTRQQADAQDARDAGIIEAEQVYAVVPREGVRPLQLLSADMFRVKKMPRSEMPNDAVSAPADLQDKVSLVPLPADAPVEQDQVGVRGPELGMAYAVRPPRRAVTVALDPVIGVAGFPKPGNHVDVLATFTTDRGMVTRTVLQDVEILALGAEIQPVSKDPNAKDQAEASQQPTATLAVLPGEAERLILAEARGKLRLALRSVEDDTFRAGNGVKEVQITGVPPKDDSKPAAPPAPSPAPVAAQPAPPVAAGAVVMRIPDPAETAARKGNPNEREIEVVRGTSKETVKVKAREARAQVEKSGLD
jgi:pilus assembly protein CpaB